MALSEKMKDRIEMAAAALLIGAAVAGSSAMAQRDPAYQQARSEGLIGEKTDGYLGFVSTPSPAVRALVEDLNIKRKAKYTEEALANGATVEEMAFRTGCRLIKERTAPGEKYQAPDGSWKTRDASPPLLDVRCP
ncbi:MAG: YdbL family protein [Sphingorhabdus sp.]|nr:YdbL family protein [Sphingorhabdus sp.]